MPQALPATPPLTRPVLWVMTISAGIVVANIYYSQPLLRLIAASFGITPGAVSLVAMLTQIGYATGLLLIVPLGDMFPRKRLILSVILFTIASLLLTALSPGYEVLLAASFLTGVSSVVPQLLVPLAAHLAQPEHRGRAIGTVMSGLLIGILCSRTLSGYVGAQFGWRTMFYIAAGMMALLWVLLYGVLPEVHADFRGSYRELMRSLVRLVRTEPQLRLASVRGALLFAGFSGFWTTLVFLLAGPPFFKGSEVAGAFGLVGAAGAAAASVIGRLTDRVNIRHLITGSLVGVLLSFGIFGWLGHSMAGLIAGVILMDLCVQGASISNQSIVYSLNPAARNRLNTVYMVTYFTGGASGTFLAAQAWNHWQWPGVVALGIGCTGLALVLHLAFRTSKKKEHGL